MSIRSPSNRSDSLLLPRLVPSKRKAEALIKIYLHRRCIFSLDLPLKPEQYVFQRSNHRNSPR